jgi:phosphatidylethanolamine-binding protein (PEBP) family uncharacterized protein
MRRAVTPIHLLALTLAAVLAGCASTAATTSGGGGGGPALSIALSSQALRSRYMPALYTCDGKDVSPPLEWGSLPSGTGEVVLYALGIKPVPKQGNLITVEWALAGVNPDLHRLAAGQVPRGASLGLTFHHKRAYSLCPPKGTTARYQFMLFAVPRGIKISPEFEGQQILEALSTRGAEYSAKAEGAFVTFYKRA